MLSVSDLSVSYGAINALCGLSFEIPQGGIVTLLGGEQQMLAIGRALMGRPKFLMLDEPSLGIAPRLITTIFEKIVEINRTQGITILLVEQNANLALEISSHGYVLETGHIVC